MKIARKVALLWILGGVFPFAALAQHSHPAPERLGTLMFPTSCAPAVQAQFERAVALLHSFTYEPAESAFRAVAEADPKCAMAHWGIAMSYFHALWEPPGADDARKAWAEVQRAEQIGATTTREQQFIRAADAYYRDADKLPPAARASAYEQAMADVAAHNPNDPEAQIFYALALLATASPADQTHANQKKAADILEPLFRALPQHPGLAHYLIHAYDSAELAPRGLAAARAYSKIAPSAPHALHMPSHVFTRLGYWDDSIESNKAARAAAHVQGDVGEELHAMDYLTYAYLQRGREADAAHVVADLRAMKSLPAAQFKIGYAGNAMPVRFAIERRQWTEAAKLEPLPQSAPHVAAIVYWARASGQARGGHADAAADDLAKLDECLQHARATGTPYWAKQTEVLSDEAHAWVSYAQGKRGEAIERLRAAVAKEEAVEKLPVTPGPIVPAREQLAEMLLDEGKPADALREFQTSLTSAPGRRGALIGAARVAELSGDAKTAAKYREQVASSPTSE